MTEVLSAMDPLRRDRHTGDNDINYSPNTDWREKYYGVAEMLAETRAELDDFHQASKELEAELENELERTEKAQQNLQAKVIKAEGERDEWKTKFMSLQTTHNTTTTSLQRELDRLRQEHQQVKIHLRELEMGNDDLERNERAVSSSLVDMENKYSRALEEKILLEHELLEKANLEEETQRLKDELRDANVEISILRKQSNSTNTVISDMPKAGTSQTSISSADDLLNTQPPPDLDLADISPSFESSATEINTTPKASLSRSALPSTFFRRAGFQDKSSPLTALKTSSNVMRSNILPTVASPSTSSPRGLARPSVVRNPSIMSTSSSTGPTKNKGVQMVSEMRARVRNLEQKIHTSVPRLRLPSMTARPSSGFGSGFTTPTTGISSASSAASNSSTAKTSLESQRISVDSRRSNDSERENNLKRGKGVGDSSGWVLIMEDSPSPQKDKEVKRLKEKRRVSNPPVPIAFRPTASTTKRVPSPSLSTGPINSLAVSTRLRRPQSRLSGGGGSASSSGSRPQTPTFLPLPSSSLYASSYGPKKSTGPSASSSYSNQLKRSSLGKPTMSSPPPLPTAHRERPITMPPVGYTTTTAEPSIQNEVKALPALPDDSHSNVTIRGSSRIPSSGSSVLLKSRIGRPSREGISGRKSGELVAALDIKDLQPRSGVFQV